MKSFKRLTVLILLISVVFVCFSCGKNTESSGVAAGGPVGRAEAILNEEIAGGLPDFTSPTVEDKAVKVEGMPEEVVWLTSYPKDLSSKDTKVGGTYRQHITEYPTTFRTVGPESNGSMRADFKHHAILITYWDETQEWVPYAATHWAFGADNQTVYYKLNEKVKWSDGVPCTADDYLFMHEFMLSPNLEDPWYNNYWADFEFKKINDYCISIKYLVSNKLSKFDLLQNTTTSPRPKHFYNGVINKGWYNDYNWKIEPTTGPYLVNPEKCVKGELIVSERIPDWWAREYPAFKHQGNVERVEFKVIQGGNDVVEGHFWTGELDSFWMNIPSLWRKSAENENITKGYVDRWVANEIPLEGISGIWFNTKFPLFSDKKVRKAMYYAIDMQGMIDQALYGEYKRKHNIGMGHIVQGVSLDDNTIKKPDFNPETARKMLAEAGYSEVDSDGILKNAKGERVAFELLYAWAGHTERLSILKEQAKKAGVEIELKLMESGAFNTVLNKKHQAYWGDLTTSRKPQYWQNFAKANAEKVSNNNFFAWWSEDMEKLLKAEAAGLSIQEYAENCKKIQRLVHEEALIVPDYYLDFKRGAAWKWVRMPWWLNRKQNASYELFAYDGYMWIDEDIRTEVLKAKEEGKTFEPRVWALSSRYITE